MRSGNQRTIGSISRIGLIAGALLAIAVADVTAQDEARQLAAEFDSAIKPLLKSACQKCHAGERLEADIDLASFNTLKEVRKQPDVWLKVNDMLKTRQMPPEDAPQLSDSEHQRLSSWVLRFLALEARAHAGDPGPVVLRRLSNAEYTYTVQDLTGVKTLNPAREFPTDGAAGEGFTNTGNALVMSPALLSKYLDAAKQVAGHAVLVPDGFRFSESPFRRDWTNESLDRIRSFYARFTAQGGGERVNLQGIVFDTNEGGRLPVGEYLRLLSTLPSAAQRDSRQLKLAAAEAGLNEKYLQLLAETLNGDASEGSLLIRRLRQRWQSDEPMDRSVVARELEAEIGDWQKQLWKFQPVGHLGREGGAQRWLEAVNPLASRRELRAAFPPDQRQGDVEVSLVASSTSPGSTPGVVIWQTPRLIFPEGPAIPLRNVRELVHLTRLTIAAERGRTPDYLSALAAGHAGGRTLEELARQRELNPDLLLNWSRLVRLGRSARPAIAGQYTQRQPKVQGYDAINGWGSDATPSLIANRSEQPITFLTLTVPPRSVVMHPSPELEAIVAWRCPEDMQVSVEALVADADDKCGNGAAWRLEWQSATGSTVLASGVYDNGGRQNGNSDGSLSLETGDVLRLIVNPRDRNHACDTTHVELKIIEQQGEKQRVWDLADDVVDRILESNPAADSYGNADTWHFCSSAATEQPTVALAPGTSLAQWRKAVVSGQDQQVIDGWATKILAVLEGGAELTQADHELRSVLLDWRGPLNWVEVAESIRARESSGASKDDVDGSESGVAAAMFGRLPTGQPIAVTDLANETPVRVDLRLPRELVAGAELVVTAAMAGGQDAESGLQVDLLVDTSRDPGGARTELRPAVIIVPESGAARATIRKAFDDFRSLFPPALCYTKIVPVDEVVTLTLYHREDEHLQRLMLNDSEVAELNRLWDELHYVSQDALRLVDAYEQLVEFATQDRPDLVVSFRSLRQPIMDRADRFRETLQASIEPQVARLPEFAARAFRRPLSDSEVQEIGRFYDGLRRQQLEHDEAFRLTMARILVSPDFLYRIEQPVAGDSQGPVTDHELATRLSYFLWSSMPDERLRELADQQRLREPEVLVSETRRMLRDPRIRRLATEFGCQWLHIYEFDQLDEKSERHFPTFADVRGPLYEEAIRFFLDCFQENRRVLSLLDARHTFMNPALASHYGLPWEGDEPWQRIERPAEQPGGGILTLGATLARQSGASRTSPILRGNWISEVVLGEKLPRPPPNVPVLDDTVPDGLTERQLIERHSSDPSCSKCHSRIDPFGFALENYDAIGRFRTHDARGLAIDARTKLPDGRAIDGLQGLKDYLLHDRRDAFVGQFNRKLLGFALGRAVQLSDQPLLDDLTQLGVLDETRMDTIVERIVLSSQFREIRGRDRATDH